MRPLSAFFATVLFANSASALEFEEGGDPAQPWVRASGDIEPGDAEHFLLRYVYGGTSKILILNSPGGDVLEALRLGESVRLLRFRTAVLPDE